MFRFQIETLELKSGKHSKYLPYVFTKEGVVMLATVLRISMASEISIIVMRAFVAMKKHV